MRMTAISVCFLVFQCFSAPTNVWSQNNSAAAPADITLATAPSADTGRPGSDWTRMLGERFDSHSSETGIRTDWPKEGLPIVWTAKTGIGYGNGVSSAGRWFQFDRFRNAERLSCYDALTGKFLWQSESPVEYRDPYGYNNGPRCSPVVDGDLVFTFGVAGQLTCYAVDTGKKIWSIDTSSEYNVIPNFFGVGASPLVYNDLLIVMIGGSPPESKTRVSRNVNNIPLAKPDGCALVAFDKRTGAEIYRVGNYLASYSAPILAELGGQERCLALVRDGLLVFDPADGKREHFFPWRASMLESVNAASPVVFGNKILISEAYEKGSAIVEWTPEGLKSVWEDTGISRSKLIRAHWSTPLRHNQMIFASSGRNPPDTDFRCLSWDGASDLNLKWSHRNRDRSTGLIADDHLILLGEFGRLQLLSLDASKMNVVAEMDLANTNDPNDGEPLVTPPSWAPPVLSHGLLYIRGADRLVCLKLMKE